MLESMIGAAGGTRDAITRGAYYFVRSIEALLEISS
jgi:hypothetical protein